MEYKKRKAPKIVQLAKVDGELVALDYTGKIWYCEQISKEPAWGWVPLVRDFYEPVPSKRVKSR